MEKRSLISYGKKTDQAMKTWVQIVKTYNRFATQEIKYFSEHNLTFIQFKVLEVLYHRVVVKNLKRDGWITAIPNPEDKRGSILSISQKGRDKMKSLFPQHAKNIHDYMDVLNEEELDTLYTLLRKVYKA
jgi:MarR family 2-MHQ and catechol resistance regulon transcriptional repressor